MSQEMKQKKRELKSAKKALKAENKVRKHGPKAKTSFRRNVVPAIFGILVMATVMGALNGQWIVAQAKYRFTKPVAAATVASSVGTSDPTNTTPIVDTKSPHPELGPQVSIPSIKVEAPVQMNQGTDEWQIQLGLRKGVVHYDTSANPGEPGNVVIFGHSSGQVWAPGNYKFVFTLLSKVQPNDAVYVDYNGTRYTYKVIHSEVVAPTDTGVLKSDPSTKELTLITCTPVGTSKNRLIVHAEQVSPNPKAVAPAPAASAAKPTAKVATPQTLPGNASGLLWQSFLNLF